jgi:hypothetical protein
VHGAVRRGGELTGAGEGAALQQERDEDDRQQDRRRQARSLPWSRRSTGRHPSAMPAPKAIGRLSIRGDDRRGEARQQDRGP